MQKWDNAVKEVGILAKSDEDILLYVLFPMQGMEFLKARESGDLVSDVIAGAEEMIETQPGVMENAAPVEFDITYHGDKFTVKVEGVSPSQEQGKPRKYYVRVQGKLEEVQLYSKVEAAVGGGNYSQCRTTGTQSAPQRNVLQEGDATAPISGRVAKILVKEADKVEKGQTIAIVEAMKMENEIHAPIAGTVKAIYVKAGDNITPADALLRIEP
jgi:biotin carboxyl carrier protein